MEVNVGAQLQRSVFDYDCSSFYYSSGDDLFAVLGPYNQWFGRMIPEGYHLYSQPLAGAPGTRVEIEDARSGRRVSLLNVSSYNYLGLSHHPQVIAAARRALERYGVGAGGSPILSGHMEVHRELETELAAAQSKEAAMVFPTGYGANLGLIQGLLRPGDWVIADQSAHASIVDGAVLSKAKLVFFRHNQVDDLERKIQRASGRTLVAVEGVYSMDGEVCPLPAIVEVARRHGARLLVDEAHSGFIYGENGRGVAERFGLEGQVDVHVGTFSKALGGQGGYVGCSRDLYNYLRMYAHSRFFSCALSPVVAAGVLEALRIAKSRPELRQKLWANVAHIRSRLEEHGVDTGKSMSQIIPVTVRDHRRIFDIGRKFLDAGLFVQPVVYPAVPKHRSCFRVVVCATHSIEELDEAASIIVRVLREEDLLT